ncbi:hypothetical protein G7076_06240 [Sphingomonas sp. HDW15A]|uniref:hypothetical protein n=1 Tax=Sphingomonas sp. HDW15A TaxID=2714942 RepID=UPI00140A2F81|nr:hypothetical protein [Sphingomonas sp. HDW15A]QIK96101.1 hypothetical protein G7076_06240 [Sphingomonas sp. HDW15A]
MKFFATILVGASALAIAAPGSAQRLGSERPKDAKPDVGRTTTTSATTTTGRKLNISKEAQKAIVELQNAVNTNDTANIPAKLAAAQAVAKTADDKYFIAINQVKAAVAANDAIALKAGVEAMEASGGADPADLSARFTDLGKRLQTAGQMDAAAQAYQKAVGFDSANPSTLALFASLREKQGQKAEAVSLMQKSFAASKAKGTKVAENNFKFAAGLAYNMRSPAAIDIAREWIAAYPSTTSWRDGLRIYRDISAAKGAQLADTMRLARAANALSGESDYFALANALVSDGALVEAKAVLAEAAKAPGVDVSKQSFKGLAAQAAKAPAAAAVDASAKAALASGDATALIDAGDSLFGAGSYAQAAKLYRAAVPKDANLANLRLGMALARAGDKPGAEAALNAVTGPSQSLARFWLLWLATRN